MPLTEKEIELTETLGSVWNEFLKLEPKHPLDNHEFVDAIHKAQHLIMIRAARRDHPDIFYTEKKNENN